METVKITNCRTLSNCQQLARDRCRRRGRKIDPGVQYTSVLSVARAARAHVDKVAINFTREF